MTETIVSLRGVDKAYGRHRILKGLDLSVSEGSVYGLLGRNGAGKTTTLRMLMDLVRPGGGEVRVLGHEPRSLPLELRQQIGYSSDSMQLIPWLRVGELLNYNGSFYPAWDPDYVAGWLKRLALSPEKRVFSLSRGDRQKLALIMAIGHRPRLLILDEPAGGLDPLARKEFLESIIELIHEAGTTIILSSHQMSDLERIADTVGLMTDGRMRFERSLEDLKRQCRRVRILGSDAAKLDDLAGLVHRHSQGNLTELILEDWHPESEQKLLRRFPEARIESSPMTLEELFLVYTSTLTAGGAACPAGQ